MIGNLSQVDQRLKFYSAVPDKQFNVKSGLSPQEEAVKQKIRQYWADKDVPNVKKLEGLNIDLSGFDPRKTSNKQLWEIGVILAEQGIIDNDLVRTMSSINLQFDSLGQAINTDVEVDAYQFYARELEFLEAYIAKGSESAKSALVDLKTSIAITMALEEYGKGSRERSLVNVRA